MNGVTVGTSTIHVKEPKDTAWRWASRRSVLPVSGGVRIVPAHQPKSPRGTPAAARSTAALPLFQGVHPGFSAQGGVTLDQEPIRRLWLAAEHLEEPGQARTGRAMLVHPPLREPDAAVLLGKREELSVVLHCPDSRAGHTPPVRDLIRRQHLFATQDFRRSHSAAVASAGSRLHSVGPFGYCAVRPLMLGWIR